MDVDSFIGKYGAEWTRLDEACARGSAGLARLRGVDIEEVLGLYLRTSAHLAEARARFRDPGLVEYLNGVVTRAHAAVYGARPRAARGLVRTLGSRYREAVRRTAPFILVAAAVVAATTLATMVWVTTSHQAQVGLLPPAARQAILRANGHRPAFAVPSSVLSTAILVNNVRVAFFAFALGVGLGIGTLLVLVQNAALLGLLAGAYTSLGKAGAFWVLILPHGLLELTAVCISAGAGLRVGWSLVDPGDRPRGRALAEEARDAAMVVLGVIPAFVLAALIEGFLTGNVPGPAGLATGAAVEAAYLGFLVWPVRRVRASRTP